MDVVERVVDQAERRCKAKGTRFTTKRKLALSLLLKSGRALSAYELVDLYKSEQGDALPVASMYRILKFLMAEQLVHRLDTANKYVACEHIDCHQHHGETQFLICEKCQKVKEIRINDVAMDAIKQCVQDSGFYIASPQLELSCICADCNAKSN